MLSSLDVETRDIYDTPDVHENCNNADGSHIMSIGPSETHLDPDGLDIISSDPSRSVERLVLVPALTNCSLFDNYFESPAGTNACNVVTVAINRSNA